MYHFIDFLSPDILDKRIMSFLLLCFMAITPAISQSYLDEIQEKWANSSDYLANLATIMPDSLYDFKPIEEEMTFREQLIHIAHNMTGLAANQLGYDSSIKPESPDDDASPARIRQFLKESFEYAAKAIAKETKATLNTETKFFAGPKTHRQIINLMNDHVTHHRGQIIVYLRLNGLKPGRYVGW